MTKRNATPADPGRRGKRVLPIRPGYAALLHTTYTGRKADNKPAPPPKRTTPELKEREYA